MRISGAGRDVAHQEERDAREEVGEAYDRYAATTPGWFPKLRQSGSPAGASPQ
jgi:hypothetical protein